MLVLQPWAFLLEALGSCMEALGSSIEALGSCIEALGFCIEALGSSWSLDPAASGIRAAGFSAFSNAGRWISAGPCELGAGAGAGS